jgi:hypothetical protein
VADLYKLSPLWWALHRDEQKLMLGTSPASSDRALVLIDDELAQVTGYSPMAKEGEAWLFKALPHKLDAKTFTADDGERVTVVTFEDAESHRAWRDHPEHREAQRAGIDRFYTEYSIQVGTITYDHRFVRDQPAD